MDLLLEKEQEEEKRKEKELKEKIARKNCKYKQYFNFMNTKKSNINKIIHIKNRL